MTVRLVKQRYILGGLALALVGVATATLALPTALSFPRMNATYRDMAPEIIPVSAAGMTIKLSSPSNSLTIRHHELELEPLGDGVHRFRGMVDFLGKAKLIAEFASAVPASIEDEVLLPTQQVELVGEVRIVGDEGGYDVTTVALPEYTELAMQSRLGNQLVGLCDMLTILSGGDCSGLAAAFGRVRLPMPPAGETYRIDGDELTAEERAQIDGYLAANR